ncbi:MAG TPA: DMT family transporter [Bacteroidota bacterium]|jgi:drug/metabolite transporter (DMT)-like permease|nr:DMT family transporter [Bacteroidota bacterium]
MPFLGELSALATACCWSGSSLSFAAATRSVGTAHVNLTRLIVAAMLLLAVVLLSGLDARLSNDQLIYLAMSGVVGFALGDTFLFQAFERLGARLTMLIMSLAPAVAAALAYFMLGEGISRTGAIGIGVTIFGVASVVLDRGDLAQQRSPMHLSRAGIVFGLLAAAGQGGGLVLAKLAFREGNVNGFVATMFRVVASLLVLFPATVLLRKFKNPVGVFRGERKAFLLTLLGALLGPFLGVVGSIVAIQHTSIGIAATLMATTPILMLPLVRMIHHEHISWRAYLGAFVAVGGVAVLFMR